MPRNIYSGTPNSDIRMYTVHCARGRHVNKPSSPTEVEGEKLKLWCDITVQQKPSLFHPWALFPQKRFAPDFFVLISSHCCTQIWRMRYGGSRSIYFLLHAQMSMPESQRRDTLKPFLIKYELYINVYDFQFQGTNARKVNCGCVYFAQILKPVLSGRTL